MKLRARHLRLGAVAAVASAAAMVAAAPGAYANSCTWTESTYSATFHCNLDGHTSFAVCHGQAQFSAYRGTPVTKSTGSFGDTKTVSGGTLYLVRGSESCSASG